MIFVEGDPDKTVLLAIGVQRRELRVAGNKGNVCNKLIKSTRSKGLVDEDPGAAVPKYIKSLKRVSEDENLVEYVDVQNNNTLMVLKPRLEDWLLEQCRKNNISVRQYYLPDDPSRLKGRINSSLDKLEKLIGDSKEIASLKRLSDWALKEV